jgi:hypothetical protein
MKRQKSSDGAGCVYKPQVFWFLVGIQSLVKTSDWNDHLNLVSACLKQTFFMVVIIFSLVRCEGDL